MLLARLALLHAVACLDVQVEGELAFELRVPGVRSGRQGWFRVDWARSAGARPQEPRLKMQARQNVTAAPDGECIYQYPEKEQVDALLSNMMNELTKASSLVFVKANDFINGVETRRGGTGETDGPRPAHTGHIHSGAASEVEHDGNNNTETTENTTKKEMNPRVKEDVNKDAPHAPPLGGDDSRFKVVNKKEKAFFEVIYSKMTEEYRQFYNRTAQRARRDPCSEQRGARAQWRRLLQHAERALHEAARRTLHDYLRDQGVPPRARVRAHLPQFLAKELSKVHAKQLKMLCDKYQLCFNHLLE
ncbi:hypothetical protein SFRURICE_003259 [Spodoptera frugiperda]|nr:hypothetical protein SFRURICE_003259 [Spodoptera frugiperda]